MALRRVCNEISFPRESMSPPPTFIITKASLDSSAMQHMVREEILFMFFSNDSAED